VKADTEAGVPHFKRPSKETKMKHASKDHSPRGTGFLNADEVAEYLRVPVSTVRYWARTGKLPSYKPFGRHIYFRLAEVDAAIEGIHTDRE